MIEDINADKRRARIVGALFIIATIASLLGTAFTDPVVGVPDYLVKVAANENRVILGALFQIIAALMSASIAISLYPILRKYNEGAALGAVCFRVIEAVFYMVSALALLSLLPLSQEYIRAGTPAASYFQDLGTLIVAVRNWANFVFGVIAFCLGALLYYSVFYQSKLIPRWLSSWGIVGVLVLLVMALLIIFGKEPSGITLVLAVPIAVQEMVLAVWLVVKGFNNAQV